MSEGNAPRSAPETWPPARRALQLVIRPVERFLHVEAAGGIVLLVMAALALLWCNSPWASSYEHVWHAPVTLGIGEFTSTRSLHFWINDALMVVFFFVVGLEIRREIHEGELADLRRAALPLAAALGGMLAPAVLFLVINVGQPSQRGWGVPMATDIAFAVGVLAVLGRRVPVALRVLLLALAIIDDIGAILVIAIFYSSGISTSGLVVVAAGAASVFLLQRVGVRRALAYVPSGAVVWVGFLEAGVHPTIAGVVLGLLTPAKPWFGKQGFITSVRRSLEDFRHHGEHGDHEAGDFTGLLERIGEAKREALSPVNRLQALLHPWVAFLIMPLFALANAGVTLTGAGLTNADSTPLLVGIVVGLVVGKPLGILAFCYLTVRLGLCALPTGVGWRGVAVVGLVSGIGFTMAIFIASLAFPEGLLLGTAKVGILIASLAAGVLAIVVGRFGLRIPAPSDVPVATTAAEPLAER